MHPALAYHRVSECRYELTGLRTASIRDQMLRAAMLTEALIEAGLINDKNALLVAGAGVAGVTCALTAAARGVDVTLIEREVGPFTTQYRANRRVDPVEFDWPQAHWSSGTTMWPAQRLPLEFRPGLSHVLAQAWETVFCDWLDDQTRNPNTSHGKIDYCIGVDARTCRYDDMQLPAGRWCVEARHLPTNTTIPFGASISCIGFSGEKVSVPSTNSKYSGFEFWSSDPIESPNCGSAVPVNALISGGGDGAQQDFLRVLTGCFGIELYRKLEPHLPSLQLQLLRAVLAEDQARRAFAWRPQRSPLRETLRRWNEPYWAVVEAIWDHWVRSVDVRKLALLLLRPDIRATWIIGGDVPGFCYGLNRVLAQLIALLHATAMIPSRSYQTEPVGGAYPIPGDEVVVRGYRLERLEVAPSHICGDPAKCIGVPHDAWVSSASATNPAPRYLGVYNLVIVRHGVDTKPLFGSAPLVDQIIPMELPA